MNLTRNLIVQFKPQKWIEQCVKQFSCMPSRAQPCPKAYNQCKILFASFTNGCQTKISYHRQISTDFSNKSVIQANSLAIKKRTSRKKRFDDERQEGKFNVVSFATAEEYDLEALHTALTKQDLYETRKFYTESDQDVLHVRAKYQVEAEPRDIFFFREGSVVLWNCSDIETNNIIEYLRHFENNSYDLEAVEEERELMNYNYTNENQTGILKNGDFYIQNNEIGELEKYTFSNAMTSSVKLGIWESMLDNYIDSIAFVTDDLKQGRKIRMSRAIVLRRTGELFALRHLINLSSDLLETPDFYWDREELERLFLSTCSYFSIQKRKNVRDD